MYRTVTDFCDRLRRQSLYKTREEHRRVTGRVERDTESSHFGQSRPRDESSDKTHKIIDQGVLIESDRDQ